IRATDDGRLSRIARVSDRGPTRSRPLHRLPADRTVPIPRPGRRSNLMRWLFGARRLRPRGVLGMNARNAAAVLAPNRRALFRLVDNRLSFLALCSRVGVPTPAVYSVFERHGRLRHLAAALELTPDCVIKPARGSSGRGVVLLTGPAEGGYRRT